MVIFLINCDTLTNLNLENLYSFHKNKKNDLTIVAANKKFSIPYGSCVLNKFGKFEKILEKKVFRTDKYRYVCFFTKSIKFN